LNLLNEIIQRILKLSGESLLSLNLNEVSLKLAFIISHANLGAEDKLKSR
jgi:hypothetical protein